MGPPGSLLCRVSPSLWMLSQPPQLLASLHADLPLVSGVQAGAKVREKDILNVMDQVGIVWVWGHRAWLDMDSLKAYCMKKKPHNFLVRKLEKWALKR